MSESKRNIFTGKQNELNAQHNSIFLVNFMLIFIGRDMFNYGFKVHGLLAGYQLE